MEETHVDQLGLPPGAALELKDLITSLRKVETLPLLPPPLPPHQLLLCPTSTRWVQPPLSRWSAR